MVDIDDGAVHLPPMVKKRWGGRAVDGSETYPLDLRG